MPSLSRLDGGTVVNPEGHTRPAAVAEDRNSPLKNIQRVRIVFLREQYASHGFWILNRVQLEKRGF
jgi:hypothetical protein